MLKFSIFLFDLQDNVDAKSYGLHEDELVVLNKSSKYEQERISKILVCALSQDLTQ